MSITGSTNPEYIAVAISPHDDISHLSTSIVDGSLAVEDDPTHDPYADAEDDDDENNEATALNDVEKSSTNSSNHDDDVDGDDDHDNDNRLKTTATTLIQKCDINMIFKTVSKKKRLAFQLGILVVLLILIIAVSLQIKKANQTNAVEDNPGNMISEEDEHVDSSKPGNHEKSKWISCNNGEYNLTLSEWMNQEYKNSVSLCDPSFHPSKQEANMKEPVKVFIMLGENNMVGEGHVRGDVEGTLDYTVFEKQRFTHLIDENTDDWKNRTDVRHVAVSGSDFTIHRNEWLGMHHGRHHIGPELQFGYIMGELSDSAPILLIKASAHSKSLGVDLLPPGSERFEYEGYMYAGYGDQNFRWLKGTEPNPIADWYAGSQYDIVLMNTKKILSDIGSYYPGAIDYEIAGFVLWQGESDLRQPALVSRYEQNLVRLIHKLREDFDAEDAKFTIAAIGVDGMNMHGDALDVLMAQLAVGDGVTYPEFASNVRTVDIRSSWRQPFTRPFRDDNALMNQNYAAYGHNAELVMEVANALGWKMANLLTGSE